MGDSKAPGRSLSESTGLRPHAASVKIDRPIFALARGLKQLAKASCRSPGASCAAEFAKPWKSEGSAALALPSVIQHSPVQNLFCMTNAALAVPLIRPRNVLYSHIQNCLHRKGKRQELQEIHINTLLLTLKASSMTLMRLDELASSATTRPNGSITSAKFCNTMTSSLHHHHFISLLPQ